MHLSVCTRMWTWLLLYNRCIEFEHYTGFATYKDFTVFCKLPGDMRTTAQMSDNERQRMSGVGPHLTVSEQDQLQCFNPPLHRCCRVWFVIQIWWVWVDCDPDISEIDKLFVPSPWEPAIWPSWESGETSMLNCFSESYPTTFAIVDAT